MRNQLMGKGLQRARGADDGVKARHWAEKADCGGEDRRKKVPNRDWHGLEG